MIIKMNSCTNIIEIYIEELVRKWIKHLSKIQIMSLATLPLMDIGNKLSSLREFINQELQIDDEWSFARKRAIQHIYIWRNLNTNYIDTFEEKQFLNQLGYLSSRKARTWLEFVQILSANSKTNPILSYKQIGEYIVTIGAEYLGFIVKNQKFIHKIEVENDIQWVTISPKEMHKFMSNYYFYYSALEKNKGTLCRVVKSASIGSYIMANMQRFHYEDTVFIPFVHDNPSGFAYINTFTGFLSKPITGATIQPILDYLLHGLCNGNPIYYEYLLKLEAYRYRHPSAKLGINIVLYGIQKSKKDIFYSEFVIPYVYGEKYGSRIDGINNLIKNMANLSEKLILCIDIDKFEYDEKIINLLAQNSPYSFNVFTAMEVLELGNGKTFPLNCSDKYNIEELEKTFNQRSANAFVSHLLSLDLANFNPVNIPKFAIEQKNNTQQIEMVNDMAIFINQWQFGSIKDGVWKTFGALDENGAISGDYFYQCYNKWRLHNNNPPFAYNAVTKILGEQIALGTIKAKIDRRSKKVHITPILELNSIDVPLTKVPWAIRMPIK